MSDETRNDKLLIAGASLPLVEGAIAAMHGGAVGAIIGLGVSGLVYLAADEMAQRGKAIAFPRPSFKRQTGSNKQGFWYRATTGKDFRDEDEMPDADDEELYLDGLTFRELLALGVIQKAISRGQMLLGFVDGEPRFGSWTDYYSCGIGGLTGTGKSTTVRCLLFQTVLARGKLIMIDPHIEEQEESLAAQFRIFTKSHVFPPCDDNQSAVLKRVRWLMKEYKRRKAHGIKGPHIILVLDELNGLIRRMPAELRRELADLLLTIAQEGRKFGLFALLIAQRWSEQDLGGRNFGAAIRTSLASKIAHRLDEEQAEKLVGRKNAARCLDLEQGHYLFRDTQGRLMEMVTPLTLESDAEYIQRLLGIETSPETSAETPTKSRENTHDFVVSEVPETTRNQPETSPESTPGNTRFLELARQIIVMQAEGTQKPEIMRNIWKVNPGSTEAYKRANEEYQQVMRFIAEQL